MIFTETAGIADWNCKEEIWSMVVLKKYVCEKGEMREGSRVGG
jgi:hypothetical protein